MSTLETGVQIKKTNTYAQNVIKVKHRCTLIKFFQNTYWSSLSLLGISKL